MLLWLGFTFLVIGLVLLRRGLRGRRVGTQPVCGACGYDLSGRPEGSTCCSECGADLSAPSAIYTGQRVRRAPAVLFAAFVVLASLTLLGVTAYHGAARVDWIRYRPVSWLLSDAGSPKNAVSNPALDELMRRARDGELGGSAGAVVARALAMLSGDGVSAPRDGRWDKLFVELAKHGDASTQDIETYVVHATALDLHCRPVIQDPLSSSASGFVGWARGSVAVGMTGSERVDLYLDGALHLPELISRHSGPPPADSILIPSGFTARVWRDPYTPLPTGKHTLKAVATFDVSVDSPFRAGPFHFQKVAEAPFEVVPRSATTNP